MALLSKKLAQDFQVGLWTDLENDVGPFIKDASNIRFFAGRMGQIPSPSALVKVSSKSISEIYSQRLFDNTSIFFVDEEGVKEFRNSSVAVRFPTFGKFQFAPFGNFVLAANGGPLLAKRTESGVFEVIPTAPNATFVAVYTPFVLTYYDGIVRWCAIDDIDEWEDQEANELVVRDMDSAATAFIPAFGGIVLFSKKKMWLVGFIGSPNWFGIQALSPEVGPFSQRSICKVKESLIGLGPHGFWRTDGNSYEFLDTPKMRSTIFKTMINPENALVSDDPANERVLITVDTVDGKTTFVWDYGANNFSRSTFNWTAADPGNGYEETVYGNSTGWLFAQGARQIANVRAESLGIVFKSRLRIKIPYGVGRYGEFNYGGFEQTFQPADGNSAATIKIIIQGSDREESGGVTVGGGDVWFETRDVDLGTTNEKYLDYLVINISGNSIGQFFLKYAVKDRLNDPVLWSEEEQIFPGQPVILRETSRYLRLFVRNTGAVENWQVTGIDYYGEDVGGRETFQ